MELRRNRTSFLIWSGSLSIFIIFFMLFYPTFSNEKMIQQAKLIFENPFMKGIISAFGVDIQNLSSALGFYTTYANLYLLLIGSLYSILLSSKLLSREENEKTAEFLLTRPVSRTNIVINKIMVFVTYSFLLNIIVALTGLFLIDIYSTGDYNLSSFIILNIYSFFLITLFGMIGFFLSLFIKRGKQILGLSVGIVVGTYFIDAIFKVITRVSYLGYISPFRFVNINLLQPGYSLEAWRIIYFLGTFIILFFLSIFFYKKKDILV